MDGELPAGEMAVHDRVGENVRVVLQLACVAEPFVRAVQRGGPGHHPAVRVDLQRAHAEAFVAEPGAQTEVERPGNAVALVRGDPPQPVRGHHELYTQRQQAPLAGELIGAQLDRAVAEEGAADARLGTGGDSLGETGAGGVPDRLRQLPLGVGRKQRACGAHGAFGEEAVLVRDAGGEQVEYGGVDDAAVPGVVQQEHLAPVADQVHFDGGQMTAQGSLVVADDVHPVAGRALADSGFRHDGEHVLDPRTAGDAHGVRRQPRPGQVHMGVDESGQHGGALEVDDLTRGQGGDGLVQTHDPAPPDAQVVGDGMVRIHGEEAGVRQSGAEHRWRTALREINRRWTFSRP